MSDGCKECKYFNPDYPMGDCGDRQWQQYRCGTSNLSRRRELWTEARRAYRSLNAPIIRKGN